MTTPVFSINSASELLERDRRTITKALRHTPPDKKERGQDRWKLPTILAALNMLPGSTGAPPRRLSNDDGRVDPRVTALINPCKVAILALQEMPLQQRREVAKKDLGPMIMAAYHRLQDLIDEYRAESIWNLWLNLTTHFCEWTHEQGWEYLVTANYDDDD
jgi:hypothetical protein